MTLKLLAIQPVYFTLTGSIHAQASKTDAYQLSSIPSISTSLLPMNTNGENAAQTENSHLLRI